MALVSEGYKCFTRADVFGLAHTVAPSEVAVMVGGLILATPSTVKAMPACSSASTALQRNWYCAGMIVSELTSQERRTSRDRPERSAS